MASDRPGIRFPPPPLSKLSETHEVGNPDCKGSKKVPRREGRARPRGAESEGPSNLFQHGAAEGYKLGRCPRRPGSRGRSLAFNSERDIPRDSSLSTLLRA